MPFQLAEMPVYFNVNHELTVSYIVSYYGNSWIGTDNILRVSMELCSMS